MAVNVLTPADFFDFLFFSKPRGTINFHRRLTNTSSPMSLLPGAPLAIASSPIGGRLGHKLRHRNLFCFHSSRYSPAMNIIFDSPINGSDVPLSPVATPAEAAHAWFLRIYRFVPQQTPAYFGAIIMFLLFFVACFFNIRHRKAYYMWIVPISALFEGIGYSIRIHSIRHPGKLGFYIGGSFPMIVVPIALAFINYLVFGRILKAYGRKALFLRPAWIAAIFLVSDVLAFLLQAGASGLLASSDASMQKTGKNIIIAGFILQLVFFTIFIWLTLHAYFISPRFRLYRVRSLHQCFIGLWVTIGLIFCRNIYRAIEYIAPRTSYIPSHEWTFYIFEFTLIALSIIAYCVYHFGRVFPNDGEWIKDLQAHRTAVRGAESHTLQLTPAAEEVV